MLSVPTKKSQTFFFLESVCANDERFLSAQAWTPVTAERHWVPGSGRPGVGEVAGSTTRLATRQQPEGPSRPPDPPTSRGLAGTRRSPQWPRTQRRGQAAGQNSRHSTSPTVGARPDILLRQSAQVAHVNRKSPACPAQFCLLRPDPAPSWERGGAHLPGSGLAREERGSSFGKKLEVRELQVLKASAMSL